MGEADVYINKNGLDETGRCFSRVPEMGSHKSAIYEYLEMVKLCWNDPEVFHS